MSDLPETVSGPSGAAMGDDERWCRQILPILRARPALLSFRRPRADSPGDSAPAGDVIARYFIGLYPDALVVAKRRRMAPPPEAAYDAGRGLEFLLESKSIAPRHVTPLEEVTRVVARPESLRGWSRFSVWTPRRRINFTLPGHERGNLARALGLMLGDRFEERRRIDFHLGPASVIAAVFIALVVLVLAEAASPSDGIPSALVLGVEASVFFLYDILDMIPKPARGRARERERKRGPDRSGRNPLQSLAIGRIFRVIAVLVVASIFLFRGWVEMRLARWLTPAISGDGKLVLQLVGLLIVAVSLAALLLLIVGHRLSQRPARSVLAGDDRPPILYLRSFRDEERNDFNPQTLLAGLLGIRLPVWIPYWLGVLRYMFFGLHPVRFLRMATGLAVDTAEEQLAVAMRRHGPFVAIGEPGERFAAPGAARMYVSHDTWQETVLDLMGRSSLVIVQPARTEGIWWEIEQAVGRVDHRRLVFCMVDFLRRQDAYETFRLRVEEKGGRPLPRGIGNLDDPTFLFFDPDGTPRVAALATDRRSPGPSTSRRPTRPGRSTRSSPPPRAASPRRSRRGGDTGGMHCLP